LLGSRRWSDPHRPRRLRIQTSLDPVLVAGNAGDLGPGETTAVLATLLGAVLSCILVVAPAVLIAGVPVSIIQVYDSRDKRVGDFGVGWRLDLQTLRLRANGVPGTRWEVQRIPGFPVDTYVLAPTDAHTVSLTLPDGKVEAFELTTTPASQLGQAFLTVDAAYTRNRGRWGLRAGVVSGAPTCVRCGYPVVKNVEQYETFERMHWFCFHIEYEHRGTPPGEPCDDPGCPWWHLELFRTKLEQSGINVSELIAEAVRRRATGSSRG